MHRMLLALLVLAIAGSDCSRKKVEAIESESGGGGGGDNPFGGFGGGNAFGGLESESGGGGGGNPFGGGGLGGPGGLGSMMGGGGEQGPIAEMSELDTNAPAPEVYPDTPDCFKAHQKMRMSMIPIVMEGDFWLNSPENMVRFNQGTGFYTIERYDLQCKLTAKPNEDTKVEKIPDGEKMSSFKLPPQELTKYEGVQYVGEGDKKVKCYRYRFGLGMGLEDIGVSTQFRLWVSAESNHVPVYMQANMSSRAGDMDMKMNVHQHLSGHTVGCNFDADIFAASQCSNLLLEPETVPLPAPAPAPPAEKEAQLKEINARLDAAKAKKGDLTISLMWEQGTNEAEDLDLHVICDGGHISYSAKKACGGTLDVDMRANAGEPVENVYWMSPPAGKYTVYVHNYSKKKGANPKAFTVVISKKDGSTEILKGLAGNSGSPGVLVKSFVLP